MPTSGSFQRGLPLAAAMILSMAGCVAHTAPCRNTAPLAVPVDPCIDIGAGNCGSRLDFIRKAYQSTVRLYVSRYTGDVGMSYVYGTGSIIDAQGTVLTAYHVVENSRLIVASARKLDDDAAESVSVRDLPMKVVAFREDLDVALLRPDGVNETLPEPFAMADTAPRVNKELWHFGAVSSWVHGKVGAVGVTYDGVANLTKASFPCRHGDSGGPFVDTSGRLVGVLLKKDSNVEGRGNTYFLPVGAALDALGYVR